MPKEYIRSFSSKSVKYLKERLEGAVAEGFLKKEADEQLNIELYKKRKFCYLIVKYLEDGRADADLLVNDIKRKT